MPFQKSIDETPDKPSKTHSGYIPHEGKFLMLYLKIDDSDELLAYRVRHCCARKKAIFLEEGVLQGSRCGAFTSPFQKTHCLFQLFSGNKLCAYFTKF